MSKKILFVYYQNIKQGGISKSLANLTKELAEDGLDVSILFLMEKHEDFYPIDPRVKKIYIDSFDTPQFRLAGKIRKRKLFKGKTENAAHYLYDLGCYYKMTSWLKKNHKNYDLIVTCWYKLSTYATLSKAIAEKTIAWEHINYKTGGFLYFDLLRKRYRDLSGVICLTKDSAEHYKLLNKNTLQIPNIIGDRFENNDAQISRKENIILWAGRLDAEKNVQGFLRILKSAKIPENWSVIIAGAGWQEQELRKESAEMELGNVAFLGAVPLEKMLELYAKSKIFCMTSLVEGLPTVLIEAMFFGNALIAYDCPTGPSEIINENNGFLIPLQDEQKFIEKLELLTTNEYLLENLMASARKESQKWAKTEIIEKWKEVLA